MNVCTQDFTSHIFKIRSKPHLVISGEEEVAYYKNEY